MTETRRIGRPPGLDPALTRTAILDAARARFGQLGYRLASIRVIAAEAGLTPAALYKHFPSKAAIFAAIYDELDHQLEAELRATVTGVAAGLEQVAAAALGIAAFAQRHPDGAAFMVSAPFARLHEAELTAVLELRDSATYRVLVDVVRAGQAAARLRTDVAAEDLARVVAVYLSGVGIHALTTEAVHGPLRPEFVDAVWRFLSAGVV